MEARHVLFRIDGWIGLLHFKYSGNVRHRRPLDVILRLTQKVPAALLLYTYIEREKKRNLDVSLSAAAAAAVGLIE